MKSQKVIKNKQTNTETAHQASSTEAAYSEHSIAIHSISMAGYITAVLLFVWGELQARETKQFLWFLKKWPLAI